MFKETTHHRLFKLKYPIISFIHKTVENTVCIKMGILRSNISNRCFSFNMIYTFLGFSGGKKNFHFPFPLCHLPAVSSQMKELSHLQKCRCILEKGDAAVIQTSKECLDLEKIIKLKEKVVFPVIKIQYISMSVRLVFLFFNKIKTISIWFLV